MKSTKCKVCGAQFDNAVVDDSAKNASIAELEQSIERAEKLANRVRGLRPTILERGVKRMPVAIRFLVWGGFSCVVMFAYWWSIQN